MHEMMPIFARLIKVVHFIQIVCNMDVPVQPMRFDRSFPNLQRLLTELRHARFACKLKTGYIFRLGVEANP